MRSFAVTAPRCDDGPIFTHEERQAAWLDYFSADDVDFFEIRNGLIEILSDDIIPDPEVCQVIIKKAEGQV